MKKIKSILLAVIIATSCFAGTITTSAATTNDTAYIYVTDSYSTPEEDYPAAPIPSSPTLTAKVGDIIEVTVTAKATTEIKNFCCLWMMTFFSQSSTGAPQKYREMPPIEEWPLVYTNKYYSNGTISDCKYFDKGLVVTLPGSADTSSDRYHYGYTMSSADNIADFTDTVTMYKFTLEVQKSGKTFINTTNCECGYFINDDVVGTPDLLNIKTSVAVVGNVNKTEITGDVDQNGVLTVADATLIQKYSASIAEFTDKQKILGDVNGDGNVNVLDSTEIQKILSK